MVRVIRICAVCGMGPSAVFRTRLKEALDAQEVEYSLDDIAAEAAGGEEADLIFTSDELSGLSSERARVIAIQNFTNRSEVRDKVSVAVAEMRG